MSRSSRHRRWAILLALVLASAGTGVVAAGAARQPAASRQEMAAVVRSWNRLLNASDNAGIARLFRLPAIFIQGQYEYRLTTRKQIAIWHSALPCSGAIVSLRYSGKFVTAVFRLGNRGKTRCDAPGSLAAARFEIVRGKIASWVQVPVPAKSGLPVA